MPNFTFSEHLPALDSISQNVQMPNDDVSFLKSYLFIGNINRHLCVTFFLWINQLLLFELKPLPFLIGQLRLTSIDDVMKCLSLRSNL